MIPEMKAKVEELINDLMLKRWKSGETAVDLHETFSLPLAFKVIYELLGIPFSVRSCCCPSSHLKFASLQCNSV